MAENYSFRSAMGGFNRSDVINYIKKLIDENAALTAKTNELEKKLADSDQVVSDQGQQIEYLQKKCDELTASKNDVVQLGAAMYDAKRFSDQLISEANEKIDIMFKDASDIASHSSEKLAVITQLMNDTVNGVDAAFSDIRAKISELSDEINGFCKGIDEKKAEFMNIHSYDAAKEYGEEFARENASQLAGEPEEKTRFDGVSVKKVKTRADVQKIRRIKK